MIRDPRRKSVPGKSKWDVSRIDSVFIWEHLVSLQFLLTELERKCSIQI